jgi:hypothetical protein
MNPTWWREPSRDAVSTFGALTEFPARETTVICAGR